MPELCYPTPEKLLRKPVEAVAPRPFFDMASMTDLDVPLVCYGDENPLMTLLLAAAVPMYIYPCSSF